MRILANLVVLSVQRQIHIRRNDREKDIWERSGDSLYLYLCKTKVKDKKIIEKLQKLLSDCSLIRIIIIILIDIIIG